MIACQRTNDTVRKAQMHVSCLSLKADHLSDLVYRIADILAVLLRLAKIRWTSDNLVIRDKKLVN